MNNTIRKKILDAVTATDSQSPFISPTQLADALSAALSEIADMMGLRRQKEWMNKEELKRRFQLSESRCKRILTDHHIPFNQTRTGKKLYSFSEFQKVYLSLPV